MKHYEQPLLDVFSIQQNDVLSASAETSGEDNLHRFDW